MRQKNDSRRTYSTGLYRLQRVLFRVLAASAMLIMAATAHADEPLPPCGGDGQLAAVDETISVCLPPNWTITKRDEITLPLTPKAADSVRDAESQFIRIVEIARNDGQSIGEIRHQQFVSKTGSPVEIAWNNPEKATEVSHYSFMRALFHLVTGIPPALADKTKSLPSDHAPAAALALGPPKGNILLRTSLRSTGGADIFSSVLPINQNGATTIYRIHNALIGGDSFALTLMHADNPLQELSAEMKKIEDSLVITRELRLSVRVRSFIGTHAEAMYSWFGLVLMLLGCLSYARKKRTQHSGPALKNWSA